MKGREGVWIADGDSSFQVHKIDAILESENGWQKTSGWLEETVTQRPVGRCCSHSGIVSPLRQLILGMCKQSKPKSNYAHNEKWKFYQLTLAAFSAVFIKGSYSLVKDNIKYRVFRGLPAKLNFYENLMGLVDFNWCLSRLTTMEYTGKSCDGKWSVQPQSMWADGGQIAKFNVSLLVCYTLIAISSSVYSKSLSN